MSLGQERLGVGVDGVGHTHRGFERGGTGGDIPRPMSRPCPKEPGQLDSGFGVAAPGRSETMTHLNYFDAYPNMNERA